MVTISKPLTAGAISRYFRNDYASASSAYYTQGNTVGGSWEGKLAGPLGLARQVTEEQFRRMAEGQHPATGEQLIGHRDTIKTQAGEELGHRAGFDLTVSAPKTVSLTALVGQDERVRAAHNVGVQDAIAEFEKYIQARMGGVNPPQTTAKMVAATFQHDTARPVEVTREDGSKYLYAAPQLHTHIILANMTEDRNGQARSLQPHELFRIQSLISATYQNRLESELRAIGYQIERGKNWAPEIKGYTSEYLAAESLRSQQIDAEMELKGKVGQESRSIAAHAGRNEKLKLTPEELKALHQQHAAEFGNQPARVVAEAQHRNARVLTPEKIEERARAAVAFARNQLSERNSVFEHFEVVRNALRHTQGRAGIDDIYRELDKQKQQGSFIAVDHVRPTAPMHRYTTPELVATERQTIQIVIAGKDQPDPTAKVSDKYIARRYDHLNADQRRLVYESLATHDQIHGIIGKAGTGKTTALTAIQELAAEHGYKPHGLAPTSQAVKGLKEAGIDSETLQAYLTRGYELADEKRPRLFFVDETSLASGEQIRDFLVTIGHRDRVLVVGDPAQHTSVQAGRVLAELKDTGMHVSTLEQIVRQKEDGLRAVVEHMAAGRIKEGVELLGDQKRIHSFEHRQERFQAIAKAYAAQPEGTLVISPDNRSRLELSAVIREELRRNGQIKPDAYSLPILRSRQDLTSEDRGVAASYRIADSVRYLRGSKALGLAAKEYVTVIAVDPEINRITVRKDNGNTVTYDPARVKGVTVYEPEMRSFAEGDRVQFTTPWREQSISTRDMATVTLLDGEGNIRVKLDRSERTVGWNLNDHKHLEHAFVTTSHAIQGGTADRTIVHIDASDTKNRALINETLAYVSFSRPRYDLQVFTDNETTLGQALSRKQDNTVALDPAEIHGYSIGV